MLTNAVQYQPGRYPFDTFHANVAAGKDVHVRIDLGGLLYEETEIVVDSVRITGDLFQDEEVSIGGTCSREVEFEVIPKAEHQYDFDSDTLVIRTMKAIVYQYTNYSDQVPKGEFYVKFDSSDKQNGSYKYVGTDVLARTDKPYATSNETLTWPRAPIAVLREISTRFNVPIDPRTIRLFETEIPPLGMNIGFPGDDENSYTYRNVLSFMGVMFCGNWIVTDEGCLFFVLLNQNSTSTVYDIGQNAEELNINRRTDAFGGIEIDLVKTDAVSGERLYRSYIPYTPCGEDEVTVSPNRFYFQQKAASYSEVNLEDYPENVNPFEQGWFIRETIVGKYEMVPIDVNDYPADTDPSLLNWYERIDGSAEYYEQTRDHEIPQIYWLPNADGGTYKINVALEGEGEEPEPKIIFIRFRQTAADLVSVQWEEDGPFETDSEYIHPSDSIIQHEYTKDGVYTITIKINEKYTSSNENASWWIIDRPDGCLLQPGKTYYAQTMVSSGKYKPTSHTEVVQGVTYYEVADYEPLDIGAEEVERGVNPKENDWYELDESTSGEAPTFQLTQDEEVVVYPRNFDFKRININDYSENTNPYESGWYEYNTQYGQYLPTMDTVVACHYTAEYVFGEKVSYRLALGSSLSQSLELRQSRVSLVTVDWGDGTIEVDDQYYWDPNSESPHSSHFTHTYAEDTSANPVAKRTVYVTLTVNSAVKLDSDWWSVISRPAATWRWEDKQYAKRQEITLQRYKRYYRRIAPEYVLIDPASENYENANPSQEGWFRHRDGDLILRGMCPWVTESGLQKIYENVLKGFRYQAYEASSALIPPTLELGDKIIIGGITTILAHYDVTLGLVYAPDISAPGTEDSESSSSSSLSMQERAYETRLADIISGAYDKVPDELSTSRRVILYLDSDTSDDNFFYVKNEQCYWISGTVIFEKDAPLTMQHRNNRGELMYWEYNDGSTVTGRDIRTATGISKDRIGGYPQTDGGVRIRMTTTPTCFPVTVYQYNDLTKVVLGFKKDNNTYLPVLKMGAGDEAGNNYAEISKPDSGLKVLYQVPANAKVNAANKIGIEATRDGYLDIYGIRRTVKLDARDFPNPGETGSIKEYLEDIEEPYEYGVFVNSSGTLVRFTYQDDVAFDVLLPGYTNPEG